MNKNIIFIFLIIIFFGAGICFGYFIFNKTCPVLECKLDNSDTFQAGWEAAKERLINLGVVRLMDKNIKITQISGKIEDINNNIISVRIIPLEPLADPELDVRKIEINEATQILKLGEKEASIYEKELGAYQELIKITQFEINTSDYPLPPNRYEEVSINLGEMVKGNLVDIETDEEIRDKKEFTAKKIIIQP